MKIAAAATIAASLAWTACSTAGPARSIHVESGESFSLVTGESVQTRNATLRVGFEGVTADSRCPKGEQCVWAGDATVRIWLQRGSGPRQMLELHTMAGAAQAASAADHVVRLIRLDPYPIAGRAVAQRDYVATLMLGRGSTAQPDR